MAASWKAKLYNMSEQAVTQHGYISFALIQLKEYKIMSSHLKNRQCMKIKQWTEKHI